MFQPIIYIYMICVFDYVCVSKATFDAESRNAATNHYLFGSYSSPIGGSWSPVDTHPPKNPRRRLPAFFFAPPCYLQNRQRPRCYFLLSPAVWRQLWWNTTWRLSHFQVQVLQKHYPHRVACWCMLDTFLQRYKRSSPYPSLSVAAFKVGPKNQLQMGWFFFALWQLRVFSNTPRQTHPIDFPVFFSGGPLAFTPIEKSTVVGRHTLGPLGATSRRLFQMRPMRLAGLFTYNGNYTFKPNVSVNNTIPMEHHLGMFYRRIKTSPEIGVSLILIVALTSYTCMTCHTLKLRVANLKLDLSFCRTIYHSFSGEVVRIDRCIHNFSYSFHLMQHQPPWARFWVLAYLGPFLRDLQHDLI